MNVVTRESRGHLGWVWALVAAIELLGVIRCIAAAEPATGRLPVYVEDSPAAIELAREAQSLHEQQRLAESAALYQDIAERFANKLMPVGEGVYTDAQRFVRQRLAGEAALLARYRESFEPAAQAAFRAATQPTVDESQLIALGQRYALCASGFEATMLLASLRLERAEALAAGDLLDDVANHPDRAAHASRWHLLQAAVGVFAQVPGRLSRHRQALEDLGDQTSLNRLREWGSQRQATPRPMVRSLLEPGPPATLSDAMESALWTERLAWPEAVAEPVHVLPRGRVRGESDEQPGLTAPLPVAVDDRVIINDGLAVTARDRHSGRTLWQTKATEEAQAQRGRLAGVRQTARLLNEPRGVRVEENRVLAVLGLASRALGWNARNSVTELVCLDLQSGAELWRRKPVDLDESLSNTFFIGTPTGGGGVAFVGLRRAQMAGFQDAYVAAVEVATGRLLWRRHLASAASAQRYNAVGQTRLLRVGQRLYVADPMGAVACLEASDGHVRWLTVHRGPDARGAQRAPDNPAGQPSPQRGLVLLPIGLFVAPGEDNPGDPSLLVDPADGTILQQFADADLREARQIIAVEQDLLTVGTTVRLYDGRTLRPRWSCELSTQEKPGLFGAASVTRRHLILPTKDRLVAINLSDGAIAWQQPLDVPGNVLALDQQLIIVGPRSVSGYVSWPRAYEELSRQVRLWPADPQPGLALAHLALGAQRWDAALEGIDAALAALQHPTDAPVDPRGATGVLRQLLVFVDPQRVPSAFLRRAILDRMATITSSPADEVAYHMALAGLLVEIDQPEEAVDHYQAVLSSPTLSVELWQTESGTRQAGLEARLRLRTLIEQRGQRVYARYESLAATRLMELSRAQPLDAAALLEVADRYPMARTAPAALLLAAQAQEESGRTATAIAHLRQAYRLNPEAALAQRIVGRLAELYDSSGQPRRAADCLSRAGRDFPGLTPLRSGRPTDLEAWRAELLTQPLLEPGLPTSTAPFRHAVTLAEVMLWPEQDDRGRPPADGTILTQAQGRLRLRRLPTLTPVWDAPAPEGPVRLLGVRGELALVWAQANNQLQAVDLRTGSLAWGPLSCTELLNAVADPSQMQAAKPAEQRLFLGAIQLDPALGPDENAPAAAPGAGTLLSLGIGVLVLADAPGRMFGLDVETGRVLWRQVSASELRAVTVEDENVLLVGVSAPNTDAQSSNVSVLDAHTGLPRFPAIEEKEAVLWARTDDTGHLFFCSEAQLACYRIDTGQLLWRTEHQGRNAPVWGRVHEGSLLLGDGEGVVSVLDAGTGRALARHLGFPQAGDAALEPRFVQRRWHLLLPEQSVALSEDGQLLWRDAVSDPVRRWAQAMGEKHLLLLCVAADGAGARANLELPEAAQELLRRVEARGQVRVMIHIDAQGNRQVFAQGVDVAGAAPGRLTLYRLDRGSGAVVDQQDMGLLPSGATANQVLLQNDLLVVGGAASTTLFSVQELTP